MSFQKIKTGIDAFDNQFQGIYLGRPALLSGKRRSGLSTHVLRFLSHLLRIGEKVLLFTEESPDHVALEAHGIGADIAEAVRQDQLAIVPYDRQLPLLPFPEALDELRELIVDRHCACVVFDPVMPWLAAPADRLDARLDAFFGLLDETSATSLVVLRHPASPLARRLYDEVAERCPVVIVAAQPVTGSRTLEVVKYVGAPPDQCPVVIPVVGGPADPPSGFHAPLEGIPLRDLHDATQRIQLNLDSYFPGEVATTGGFFASAPRTPTIRVQASSAHPTIRIPASQPQAPAPQPSQAQPPLGQPSHAQGYYAPAPAPAVPHGPHFNQRRPGEPAVEPLPLALPLTPGLHVASNPSPSAPAEPPPPAPAPAPAPEPPAAPAAHHAIRFADASQSAARPRGAASPSPAAPSGHHAIRFADAADDAPRPPKAPAAPAGARPRPNEKSHAIHFSDIIQ